MELESHPTVNHPGGSSLAHDLPSPKSDTLTPKSHADRLDPPSKPPEPVVAPAGASRSKKDTPSSKKHVEKEDERDDKKTKSSTIPPEPAAFEHDPDARATRYEPEPSKGKRASTRQDKQRERETLTPVLAPTVTDHPATKPPASKSEEPPDADPPGSPSDRLDPDVDDAVFDDEDLSNTTPREDATQDPEEDESKSHAHSTASSLSSVPDDFPLSRSVSPSPAMPERKRKRDELEVEDASGENEDDENDGEEEEAASLEEEEGSVDDDDEYQKKHREALHALTQIEIEFAKLRDKVYHEKIAELDEEVVMINNGTHPGLSAHMAEIEQKRQKRLDTAAAWKKYQQWGYHRQYEGFEYQANVHFIAKKSSLRREMINSLNAKQWKLEEEHNQLNEMIPRSLCDSPSHIRSNNTAPNPVQDKQELMRRKKLQRTEAGDLKSIRETIGFPAAPHVHGLLKKDMDEDYEVLGVSPPRTLGRHHTLRTDKQGNQVRADGIYTQAGVLRYNDQWFRKGDTMVVVDANAGRYTAKMLAANDTEVRMILAR
ncbi:Sds3-like-domain-containing protein [Endogone sp. FLAS-F59071]|nr:Sds3-like-domain-containing protein [Endogone sp. FLAS-F59071]|eukprot:RUS21910.1 Sds3-like-domain-containing protein [Endogone sp. FLAS-F59071]